MKAKIYEDGAPADQPGVTVLFNPSEYRVQRDVRYASLPVPGLQNPVVQFVRGESPTLDLRLFLDRDERDGNINDDLAALRRFVTIDGELHTPPVAQFVWGGAATPGGVGNSTTQPPAVFRGVVEGFDERVILFDSQGNPTRAWVSLRLRAVKSPDEQRNAIGFQSPDRTKTWVVKDGETLSSIAGRAYENPSAWREIAQANRLGRVRDLAPGTVLVLPALTGRT